MREEPRTEQIESIPAHLLERLWIYVNFDCNLACSYCVADSGPRNGRSRIDLETFRRLTDEAATAGCRQIIVTGGEPLLHPDILAILEYAGATLATLLLTNATLIPLKRFEGLRRFSQSIGVQVSLDSADPEIHDRLRGKGSWKRVVRGTSLLLDWGFSVSVRATRAGQTEAEMQALDLFLRRLGVPLERRLVAEVAEGGRSREGLRMETADLLMEPTIAADGLYAHPLKVAPSLAVTGTILPLKPALMLLAGRTASNRLGGGRRYR